MNMDREAIETKVIAIVSDQMGVDRARLTRETAFVRDLGADSLETVELVLKLEDAFSTDIPDEEAEKMQTVGAAVDYIVRAAQAQAKNSAINLV